MFLFFPVLMTAFSLSMDTFSLSLSYGMINVNKKDILKISFFVGLFHFFMPLLGNIFGELLFKVITIDENKLIGLIFFAISLELLISLFKEKNASSINNYFDIILFSFTVSIDSFITGMCLDVFNLDKIVIVSIFMFVSFLFTFIGFILGYSFYKKLGLYAEIIGVIILISLSFFYLIY